MSYLPFKKCAISTSSIYPIIIKTFLPFHIIPVRFPDADLVGQEVLCCLITSAKSFTNFPPHSLVSIGYLAILIYEFGKEMGLVFQFAFCY